MLSLIKNRFEIFSIILGIVLLTTLSFAFSGNKNTQKSEQVNQIKDLLNQVGSWQFGIHEEVAIDESRNLAFLNSGSVVLILDISNPSTPVLINDTILTSGLVHDLWYDATTQHLYTANGDAGIQIWDLQDINSPQLLSSLVLEYAGTTPAAIKLASKPGFLFVAAGYGGIITINISDALNPVETAIQIGPGGSKGALDIDDSGNYIVTAGNSTELYFIEGDGSLTLVDVGTPLISGLDAVEIYNDYAYEIVFGYLYIIDLSTAGLPIANVLTLPGGVTSYYSLTASDNKLYVSDPQFGLEIYNLNNPVNPFLLGSNQTTCKDIEYFSGNIFAANLSGMNVFDVSNPANPVLVGNYQGVGGSANTVKVQGSYSYFSTVFKLYVLNISDPSAPFLAGSNTPESGIDVDILIHGNYIYVTNTQLGLRIVDISDPSNPVTIGNIGQANYGLMCSENNYIYLTDSNHSLRIFDISNPESPVETGSLQLSNTFTRIDVSNGYVYAVQYSEGLKVIDVSDPHFPQLVSVYNQNVQLEDIVVKGNYAYTPDLYYGQTRIYVFDISNPLNPNIVGTLIFPYPVHAYLNFIYNDVLFVTDLSSPYLTQVDVSNPSQPTIIDYQPTADFVYGIEIKDDYIYAATFQAGLYIYENPYGSVPVELTSFTASVDRNNISLNWQTSTETNNSGFEIQRSDFRDQTSETFDWKKIGFIKGNGTSTKANNYSYLDNNLETGSYSYRLVQIDFDGTRTESKIVNVNINSLPAEYSLSQNYPNPFNPATTIQYSIPESGNVKLKIYNSLGEEVVTLVNDYKEAGTHEVNFDASKLNSGIYYYKIQLNNFSEAKKMMLLK